MTTPELAIELEGQATSKPESDAFVFLGQPEISLTKRFSQPCTTWSDTEH